MLPETFALLQNLLTREVTDVSYEEVKAALRQHFEEKRNFLAARLDFFRTVQQECQSITDVLAELRNKAKECDFEEQCCVKCQDNALRDRLVMGCRHTFIQQAILKEGDASLANVLQCAKMAELLSKALCKMHEQTTDHTTGHTQQGVHAVRHSQPSRQKQRFRDKQRPEHAEKGQANTQPNRRGQKVCYRCGSLTHHHRDCPFINAVCYGCDRKGHIQAVCRSSGKPVRRGKMAQHMVEKRTENISVKVFSTSTHVDKPQILLQISNVDLVFELDTGADVSLVGPDIWKRIGSPQLTSPKIQLFSYGKQPIPVKGECNVTVTYNGGNHTLPLIVVKKAGTSLFALDWIKAYKVDVNALLYHNTPTTLSSTIDCNVIDKCDRDLQRVLDEYPAVFAPGLGLCTKMKARLLLKDDAVPKFVKPRPVPFSRMEAVDKELHRLEDHANTDALSRLHIGSDPDFDKDESIVEIDSEVNMLDSHVILNLPLSAKTVADYTRKDPILTKVLRFVTNGWPSTWPHNQDKNKVRTYLNAQTEITSKDGVLLRDSRIIIPTALCARFLNMLHLTHIGIVRMKSLARMHVW